MKKLLILMLVLGLAPASYGVLVAADFELRLDEATNTLTVVGLIADPGVDINAGIYDEADKGDFSIAVALKDGLNIPDVNYAAGALWSISIWSGTGYEGIDIGVLDSSPSLDPVDMMDWFTVQYTGSVGDTMQIYDYYVSDTVPAFTKIVLVPEPMTIALLGLGGLLLRRRK